MTSTYTTTFVRVEVPVKHVNAKHAGYAKTSPRHNGTNKDNPSPHRRKIACRWWTQKIVKHSEESSTYS